MQDKAFELIFREYNRMLTAYLYSLTGNWDTALDLTQDAFVVAYRKMGEFDSSRSLAAWLRGIARNLARNAVRKERRSRQYLMDGSEMDEVFAVLDDSALDAAWEDRVQALQACLDKLPERQRQAIELFYQREKSARETAGNLGVMEKTVFQFLWQARRNLKGCIQQTLSHEGA